MSVFYYSISFWLMKLCVSMFMIRMNVSVRIVFMLGMCWLNS